MIPRGRSRRNSRPHLNRPHARRWLGFLVLALFATSCTTDTVTTASDGSATDPAPTVAPPQQAPPASEDPGSQRPVGGLGSDAIMAANESWLARGITAYSYTAQIYIDGYDASFAEGCGATGGMLTTRVVGRVPVEARLPEVPCTIDIETGTGTASRIPLTFGEWFEFLAEVAPDGLDTQFELGDLGEPRTFFTAGLSGSVQFELIDFLPGAETPDAVLPSTVDGDLAQARQRWETLALRDYTITVARVCRCTPEFRGPFDVTVREGLVESILVAGAPAVAEIAADSFTVDGLFGQIDESLSGDRLDVVFDPQRGIPVTILSDPTLGTADDEVELRVVRFQPLPLAADPIAEALAALGSVVGDAPEGTTGLGEARFCGIDEASINDEPIGGDPIARACLADGVARGVASVLVQARPTVEGDPIVQVLRSTADSSLVVTTDSSRDAFGSGGWSITECAGITSRPEIGLNFFVPNC